MAQPSPYPKTAYRSVYPFLHSSRQEVLILYKESPLSSSKLPLCMGISTPSNTRFLRPTRIHNPNGIAIGSAVFAELTTVTDRQTDTDRQADRQTNRQTTHATPSVTAGRIYVV